MAEHRFRILNVFTERRGRLTGNPLCVVEDGSAFDDATMQALARQFNLSETTFILPSTRAAARVRIFTPSFEMGFAGHPTLGTAHVVRALGLGGDALALEMPAGIIPVDAQADRWALTAPAPRWREFEPARSALAGALGLAERDIGERPLWVATGSEYLIVPLESEEALSRIAHDPGALAALGGPSWTCMVYVFALRGARQPDGARHTVARFFFSQDGGMLEDPATGSAAANFGGWCIAVGWPLPLAVEISQGTFVKRPSALHLTVDRERRIRVGGDVIELAHGLLEL